MQSFHVESAEEGFVLEHVRENDSVLVHVEVARTFVHKHAQLPIFGLGFAVLEVAQELHGVFDEVDLVLAVVLQGKHDEAHHMVENFGALLLFEVGRECSVISVRVFVLLQFPVAHRLEVLQHLTVFKGVFLIMGGYRFLYTSLCVLIILNFEMANSFSKERISPSSLDLACVLEEFNCEVEFVKSLIGTSEIVEQLRIQRNLS